MPHCGVCVCVCMCGVCVCVCVCVHVHTSVCACVFTCVFWGLERLQPSSGSHNDLRLTEVYTIALEGLLDKNQISKA